MAGYDISKTVLPNGDLCNFKDARVQSLIQSAGASNIVSVNDALAYPAVDVTISIEPIQAGSGDPSPTNVRPISGWTGANVVVSPTTDAQDGTTYPISWQAEAGTVYGGTLDVTTGLLTVTMAEVDLGTLTWTKNASSLIGLPCFYATIPRVKPGAAYFNCSEYVIKHGRSAINGTAQIAPGNTKDATYCVVRDDRYADLSEAEFKATVSGNQLVYELATPQTYQLTPTEVTLLLGENNVWADTGDTTLKYRVTDAQGINEELITIRAQTVKKTGDTITGTLYIQGRLYSPSIELKSLVGSNHGAYVDFKYNGEDIDYTSRIIENQRGVLDVNGIPFDNANPVIGVPYGGTGATDAVAARANLGIHSGTMVTSFNNGSATLPFSTFGLNSRPSTLVITLDTLDGFIRYDWDNSASNIVLVCLDSNKIPYTGAVRYSWIAIP